MLAPVHSDIHNSKDAATGNRRLRILLMTESAT